MAHHRDNPKEREAQRRLAEEITTLVHGEDANRVAGVVTAVLRGQTAIGEVSEEIVENLRHEIPSFRLSRGWDIVNALVETGLASSRTEARRLISGNAITVNGQKIQRDTFEEADFVQGRLLLRKGKAFKDSALVEHV
jgi:tyrosyl-tRNA synthetase